jgi:YHS domain-containing protein
MGSVKPFTKIEDRAAVDPVCGMDVSLPDAKYTTCYQGISYYFCAEGCRRAFEKNPEKYLKLGTRKRKGLWGRYLDRLNRATNGQAVRCH